MIQRLNRELEVIGKMGFAGTSWWSGTSSVMPSRGGSRSGPAGIGRGSLVAYSLGITNIDPLRYGLLFERFLNPERISMPDMDIDFCFERRGEVIEYVTKKYGEENVTQIITFGPWGPRPSSATWPAPWG